MALFRTGVILGLLVLWPMEAVLADPMSVAEDFLHQQLLNNVVAITVSVPGVVSRVGMGFVIARQHDTLWIVTARHVVAMPAPARGLYPASAVSVHRRGDPTVWTLDGAPLTAPDGEDIAFLPVKMPLAQAVMDSWDLAAIAAEPQVGERIWIAGKVQEIEYDSGSAHVTAASGSAAPKIAGVAGDPGQSGSPVVLQRGIIGMLVSTTGEIGIVPIEAIQEQATLRNLPWMLTDSGIPPPIPTHACLVATGLTGVSLGLNGPRGVIHPGSDGCTDTLAGKYRLVIFGKGINCVPPEVTLTREKQQTLRVTCSTDPGGIWQSATGGYLNITSAGENEWQVSGMDLLSPHGPFQGTLQGIPPILGLSAQANDGAMLQGPVELGPTSLKGRVLLNGSPVDINFQR